MYIPGPTKASGRLWKCSGPKCITSSRIKRAILRAQLQEFKPFIDFFHSELLFQGLGALHILKVVQNRHDTQVKMTF